jgi:hypothetical protein
MDYNVTQFDLVYDYINKNKLHNEVNKLANKLDNIKLAMLLIYYDVVITDDIVFTSRFINQLSKIQDDDKIKSIINEIKNVQ